MRAFSTLVADLTNPSASPGWLLLLTWVHLPPGWLANASRLQDYHFLLTSKKWLRPYGKNPSTSQAPDSKAFHIHCSSAQHMDWVQDGKVGPEFFQGSIGSYAQHAHPRREASGSPRGRRAPVYIGYSRYNNCSLVLAHPVATHDEGSVDAELMMDLDVSIPHSERKCPRVLPRKAPVILGNHKELPWELRDEGYSPWIAVRMFVGTI